MNPGNNGSDTPFSDHLLPETGVMAYVKPIITDRGRAYAVCDSHGTTLALFSSEEAAFYAAKQHDLDPVLIH